MRTDQYFKLCANFHVDVCDCHWSRLTNECFKIIYVTTINLYSQIFMYMYM